MTAAPVWTRRLAVSPWPACGVLLLLWVAVLRMALTGQGLAEDDHPVLSWLVGHRTGALDGVFEAVSSTPVDGAVALLGGALVLLVAVRARTVRPLATLAAAVAGAVVLAELVKALVARPRPAPAVMLGVPETGSGFPSAHTLVFTALVGAVALVVWRAGSAPAVRSGAVALAVLASAVMGASRLYLGDHWLTDVLASYALAGVVLTAVAALTARRVARR
jgi:undecaprenyl-diphosphatase